MCHDVNIVKNVTSNVDKFSVCWSIALRMVSPASIFIAVSNEVSHACVVCREPCEVQFFTSAAVTLVQTGRSADLQLELLTKLLLKCSVVCCTYTVTVVCVVLHGLCRRHLCVARG